MEPLPPPPPEDPQQVSVRRGSAGSGKKTAKGLAGKGHTGKGHTGKGRKRRGGEPGELQTRVIGNVSVLLPAARPPAVGVGACLEELQQHWQREGHLAALWQAWPRLAGPQLAPHCRPLSLLGGILTVGAAPGPWLQGLQYARHQLLGALRGAGFPVRDVRVQQHHRQPLPAAGGEREADVWARHPSRIDVHGLADCPCCGRPAPTGEMALWGSCSFCRRRQLSGASGGDG